MNNNENNHLSDNVTHEAESGLTSFAGGGASDAFKNRILLLIEHIGSAAEIARRCGFSESVVRSWRDGNSDPSRSRCLQLAAGTGVSLYWLLAGVEPMWAKDLQPNERDTLLIALGDPDSEEVRAANRRRDEAIRAWSAGFAAAKEPEPSPHKASAPGPGAGTNQGLDHLPAAVRIVEGTLRKYGIRDRVDADQFAELVRIVFYDLARGAADDTASAALARILAIIKSTPA